MAFRIRDYPILLYLTILLPILLLAVWWIVGGSVWYLMLILTWLGTSFVLFFLPIDSEKSYSQ
jgi:hypothetical protein